MATFSTFGKVSLAHVVYDNKTRKSMGYGYVEMEDVEEAIAAIQALKGFEINGRKIDVKIASPKSDRPKREPKPASEKKEFKKPFNKKFSGNRPYKKEGGYQRKDNNNTYPNREGGATAPRGNYQRGENSRSEGYNRGENNRGNGGQRPRFKRRDDSNPTD